MLYAKLLRTDWTFLTAITNCDNKLAAFLNKFKCLYDLYIPKVKKKEKEINMTDKWITDGIRRSISLKNKLHKNWIKYPSLANYQHYSSYRKQLKSTINKAKRTYYDNLLKSYYSDLQKTWKVLKDLTGLSKNCKKKSIQPSNIKVNRLPNQ